MSCNFKFCVLTFGNKGENMNYFMLTQASERILVCYKQGSHSFCVDVNNLRHISEIKNQN